MDKKELGKKGEEWARKFLLRQGYKIIATNHRSRFGEIDIISEDKGTVVFIEVKTRSSIAFGTPIEAVTHSKQKRLYRLAEDFLITHHLESKPVRFDVLSLTVQGNDMKVEHVIGAF